MREDLRSKIIQFGDKIVEYLNGKGLTAYDVDVQGEIEKIENFSSINIDLIKIMSEIFTTEDFAELNNNQAYIHNNGNIKILLGEHSGPVNRIASYYLLSELGAYKDFFWIEEVKNDQASQIDNFKKENNFLWLNEDKTKKVVFKDLNFNPSVQNGNYEEADKEYKKAKIKSCATGEIPIIITADGKCHLAYKYHYRLATWLAHMGIDLKNAIRVRIFYKNNGYLNIEPDYSVKNMCIGNGQVSTFAVALTKEQVKRIIEIYDCCMVNNSHFNNMEDFLTNSTYTSGLGFNEETFKLKIGEIEDLTKYTDRLFSDYRNYYSSETVFSILNSKNMQNKGNER